MAEFIHGQVEAKVVVDEQGQGKLKATESEGGEKEGQNQQADLGMRKCVTPLFEVRACLGRFGGGLAAFREDEKREDEIQRALNQATSVGGQR